MKLPRTVHIGRITALIVLVTVLGACGGTAKTSTSTPASTSTVAPTSVTPANEIGPYKVGRQTLAMDDVSRNRKLDVDVWYPVSPTVTGTPSRYSFLPTVYFDSSIALDKPPVAPGEAFPLVIYSHGSGGLRYVASYFTEALASHGFIVVSADHTGDTATDQIVGTAVSPEQNAVNRVSDVDFEINTMLAKNTTAGDPFEHAINPDAIGTTGHSFGGFTAIAAVTGYSNPMGSIPGDARIKAVGLMAPFTTPLDDATLAKLSVPTIVMTGTKDTTTPIHPMTDRLWEFATASPMYKVELTDGGHQSFSDVCFYQRTLPSLPEVPQVIIDTIDRQAVGGCGPGLLDDRRAQQVANTFIISFLETELAHVDGYSQVLTTDGASAYPEVVFSAK
ncbi:MAG: hypothetical protein WCK41_10465 [Actinomycetes bacterium]